MISDKMTQLGKKSSVIREIFEYGKSRKAQIGNEKVFDFSIGNPSVPAPKRVNDIIKNLVDNTDPVMLHGYTSANGDANVRKAIADDINAEHAADVKPELIYLTCGAAASLTISLKAIMNKDDEIIIIAPFFPEYKVFVENAGGKPVVVMSNDKMQLDFEAISKSINKHTKGIIINSPNNPSGVIISEEELKTLGSLLEQKQKELNSEIFLIADEPYRKLAYDGMTVPFATKFYKNTIICYSFSKALSLPGERIGYILVSPKCRNAQDVYAAVCGAGRSLGFVCAPSLWQYTVAECLDLTADLAVYRENRRLLCTELTSIGYEMAKPDGAFYIFMKALESDAAAFCERAKKYELLLVPSDSFGCPGYVRIAYCVTTQQIKNSLPAFKKLYEDYKKD